MAGIYSVGQVNAYIKNMFVQDFALSRISVRGEVSNCKYHTSGHLYFTLKDKSGTLSAVMFASQRRGLSFQMREGQQVVVTGSVDVYERDGRYQLYARKIEPDGCGDLYRKFLELKQELEDMGMFAPEYKKPIPRYALRVGVVTAPTGAAIRDIMNIAARRNPYVQLVLYPALVQGSGAAESVAAGIRALDELGLDVMIVGRGGGSMEDLQAFNEETVARAIFECGTPVISAVGHETDVTIADYAADLRAPTPSAAAELAVFDLAQFDEQLASLETAFERGMERQLARNRYRVQQYGLRLQVHDPVRRIREKKQRLARLEETMAGSVERRLSDAKHRLSLACSRLRGLSPLDKISNGFGFVTGADGQRVCSVGEVRLGDGLTVRIRDGKIRASVTETEAYGIDGEENGAEDVGKDNGGAL